MLTDKIEWIEEAIKHNKQRRDVSNNKFFNIALEKAMKLKKEVSVVGFIENLKDHEDWLEEDTDRVKLRQQKFDA